MPETPPQGHSDLGPTQWVKLTVRIPADWHAALVTAARSQGCAMADLVRIGLRALLVGRYSE